MGTRNMPLTMVYNGAERPRLKRAQFMQADRTDYMLVNSGEKLTRSVSEIRAIDITHTILYNIMCATLNRTNKSSTNTTQGAPVCHPSDG